MSVPQFSEFDLINEVASIRACMIKKTKISKTAKKKNPGNTLGKAWTAHVTN